MTRRDRGQGLTENILVVFLVAIALIGVVGIFGNQLRMLFGTSAAQLAGGGGKGAGTGGAAPSTPGGLADANNAGSLGDKVSTEGGGLVLGPE